MRHRLIAAAAAAAGLALIGSVQSAFTTTVRGGPSVFEAADAFPPRNLTPPAISGTAREGETLTASTGTWARDVTSVHVEWRRCATGGESCTPAGEGTTRRLTADDVGHVLRVSVTATNDAGASEAVSAPTEEVRPAPPVNTTPPTVSGTATVGQELAGDPGTWERPAAEPAFRWLRCMTTCEAIPRETGRVLLLTGDLAGATLRFEVTHDEVSATSQATAAVARATYTHVLCANPATGQGVGADGVLPDGWSHVATLAAATSPASATRCAGSGAGIPHSTNGTYTTSVADDRTSLLYRTPAHVEFRRAELYRHGTMSGRWSWAIQHTSATNLFSPRVELCSWGHGCLSRGVATPRFDAQNRVAIPFSATNGFNVTIACDIGSGSHCSADGSQVVRIFGGTATLIDTAPPRPTAPATGTMATADPLPERPELAFSAADDGTGLYRVVVRVDDAVVDSRPVHGNSGRCADVDPGNDDPYEFAHQRPCVAAATPSIAFDASAWPPGHRRLRVLLEDAGRNTTVVVDRRVTIGDQG